MVLKPTKLIGKDGEAVIKPGGEYYHNVDKYHILYVDKYDHILIIWLHFMC